LPDDAVVLSDTELAALQDRLFQLRCAAEDVVTAADDGAASDELRRMAQALAHSARDLERLR
jgi:tellurite resistance protein